MTGEYGFEDAVDHWMLLSGIVTGPSASSHPIHPPDFCIAFPFPRVEFSARRTSGR
jgi:hypothetical protein